MLRSVIEKLGKRALSAGIDPLARDQRSGDPVLGFDTEYDSKTRKLVCFQLAGEQGSGLYTERLSVESLARRARGLIEPGAKSVWLATYWSYAELQFLPVLRRSFGWRLYGAGSFDCIFCADDGFELRVFDLARFFERSPLAKVAVSFGLEKINYDTKRVTKKSLRNPEFLRYAIRDAELCYQIIDAMRYQFVPMGADPLLSKTAAGTAATVFRRRFLRDKVRCDLPAARLAGMASCWGGRAEVFRRGKFPCIYEYDFESAYARAAVTIGRFPAGSDLQSVSSLRTLLERKHAGFAKVIFRFPEGTRVPSLPVMTRFAQVYPLRGISWATSFELRRALDTRGTKLELVEGYGYSGGDSSLVNMIAWALELRRGATGARSLAGKLLANALIGKLAQRRQGIDIEDLRTWCEKMRVDIRDAIALAPEELGALGIERIAKVGTCFAPEWNALITGYIRARLHGILETTNPIYCATDSVWVSEPITDPPSDLGLKRQGAGIVVRTRFGGIWHNGPRGEPHVAHHSVWKREAGIRLLEGVDTMRSLRYYSRRAIKLRESLRRRLRLATFLRELRVGDSSWDEKRSLLPDGSTRPWGDVEEYLAARKRYQSCLKKVAKRRSKR